MKRVLTNLLLVLIFLTGLAIATYPLVSNQFNLYRASLLINDYEVKTETLTEEDYTEIFDACDEYNSELVGGEVPDVFSVHTEEASPEYMALLNMEDDGIMGTIEIPKIGIRLPIYHTTFDDVLQNGVGHMEGSSLPVGGASTHCVLAGHRGLPSAKLFTDLDQIEEGDFFSLHVLNRTMFYQVDQILIVEPVETESLAIEEGEDYVTLVTCTPYGINTHRMLVRGKRVFPEDVPEAWSLVRGAAQTSWLLPVAVFAIVPMLMGLLFYAIFNHRENKRARRERLR